MAVTINWNGDITGLPVLNIQTESPLYKVSNKSYSLSELEGFEGVMKSYCTNPDQEWNSSIMSIIDLLPNEMIVITAGDFTNSVVAIAVNDIDLTDLGDEGIIEKGVYFVSNADKYPETGYYVSSLYLPNATDEITPLASIEYNGETIAQLNAGETCTLKCAGLPMASDIIVKINEVN